MAVVVRCFECAAAVQETDIHTTIDFLQTLGLDVGRTRSTGQREPVLPAQLWSVQQREFLAEQRLIARLTVRRAQLELAALPDQALEPVGPGEAREDEILVDVAVYTAALGAYARCQDDAISRQERLLVQVQRERPFLGEVLLHRRVRPLVHVLLARHPALRAAPASSPPRPLPLPTGRGGPAMGPPQTPAQTGCWRKATDH